MNIIAALNRPAKIAGGDHLNFIAMERITGWHGSIVAIMNAKRQNHKEVNSVEVAVPAPLFVEELRKRGISMTEKLDTKKTFQKH